jgi:hypothetical protein
MHLEGGDPVLERVLHRLGAGRKLAWPAGRDEAGARPGRDRAAEDEAARLRCNHDVDLQLAGVTSEQLDGVLQRRRVEQQRRDVLEDDPLLRKVRDVPYVSAKVQRD